MAQSGTWSNPAGGTWTDSLNWASGVIADGDNTAFFNSPTLDPLADAIVTLGADRTIARLSFGDADPVGTPAGWTVAAGNILTLAGTGPNIHVDALGTGKSVVLAAQVNNSTGFTKTGVGTVTFTNAANVITGPITISGGRLNAGTNGNFTNGGIGTGAITLANGGILGTANMAPATNTWSLGATNTVFIAAGDMGTITAQGRAGFGGAFSSGAGATLNMNVGSTQSRHDLMSSWTGFHGTLNISGAVAGNNVRMITTSGFNAAGFADVAVNLSGTAGLNPNHSGSGAVTFNIGSLSGTSGTNVQANNVGLDTLSIGALNTSTEFAGTMGITGALNIALIKVGSGTLTLSNAANAYSSTTAVNAGTLNFTGNKTGAGAVSVANGATISGTGSVTGTTTIASGGKIAAGLGVVNNTFTLGALTMGGGTVVTSEFNGSANDLINVTGALTINGTNTINLFNEGLSSIYSTNGTYNIFSFGTLAGTGISSLAVSGASQIPGKTYTLGTVAAVPGVTPAYVTLTIGDSGSTPGFWNIDASGSWGTASDWTGSAIPSGPGAFAGFGGGGTPITLPRTVTLDGNRSVGTLSFNSAVSFTIAQGSSGTLTLDNSGTAATIVDTNGSHTVSAPLALTTGGATVNVVNASDTLTLSGGISGTAAITFGGAGNVSVGGANTYIGTTSITGGVTTLVGSSNVLPTTTDLIVASGGSLNLGGTAQSVNTLGGAGTVTNNAASNSVLTVTNGGTFTGVINNGATNNVSLVVSPATTLSIGPAVKTYSGGTSVGAGAILDVGVALGSSAGTGAVTLNNATIRANGAFNLTSPISAPATTSNTFAVSGSGTGTFASALGGDGNITILTTTSGKLVDYTGNATALNGTFSLPTTGLPATVRFSSGTALGTATTFDIGLVAGNGLGNSNQGDKTYTLGALTGGAGTFLKGYQGGTGSVSPVTTYSVGANGASTTFSGQIRNGDGTTTRERVVNLTKVGAGTLTLDGDTDIYTGSTNVNAGVLVIVAAYDPTPNINSNVTPAVQTTTTLTVAAAAQLQVSAAGSAKFFTASSPSSDITVNGTLSVLSASNANVSNVKAFVGTGTVNLSAGALSLGAGTDLGTFSVASGGLLAVDGTSKVKTLTISGTPAAPTSKVAVSKGAMVIIDYTGTSVLADTRTLVSIGKGAANVNGVYGYTGFGIGLAAVTVAENVTAGFNKYAVGAIDNADLIAFNGGSGYTVFNGLSVDADSVLLRATYAGDANLDGFISAADYSLINRGFAGTIANVGWLSGDFTGDGLINADDYAVIDFGFLTQTGQLGYGDPITVPEPTSLALLGLGSAALVGRRRRQA